jgi:hypothetical protein
MNILRKIAHKRLVKQPPSPLYRKTIKHAENSHVISLFQRKKLPFFIDQKLVEANLKINIPEKYKTLPQFKNTEGKLNAIVLEEKNNPIGFISRFHSFIPPKYRKTKLAERLLKELETFERQQGAKFFVDGGLNLERIKFLLKQGYKPTKKTWDLFPEYTGKKTIKEFLELIESKKFNQHTSTGYNAFISVKEPKPIILVKNTNS